MSGKPPSRRGGVADSDRRLWQRVTSGIRPLKRRAGDADAPPPAPPKPLPQPAALPATPVLPPILPPFSPPAAARRPPPPVLEPGSAAGLDARTLARLKRGLMPPEAQIDLHHATQQDAHHRLARFLASAQAAERRCVLVITGKGFGADGQVGVLKASVPRWLNEPPNREKVLAFCHATPPFGGEGALFILLRRLKARAR